MKYIDHGFPMDGRIHVVETDVELYHIPTEVREADVRAAIDWDEDTDIAEIDFEGFEYEVLGDGEEDAVNYIMAKAKEWFTERGAKWVADVPEIFEGGA